MSAELLVANLTAHWIQAGVLSSTMVCALRLLRVKDPRLTLGALQLVLVLIVLLPWMQRWQTREREQPVSVPAQAAVIVSADASAPIAMPPPPSRAPRPVEPAIIALGAIAAGIVLRFAWLLLGFLRLRRFAGETRSIAPPEFAEEVQARVGAVARYLEHPTAGSPSTFGIFRPRVVLPARFSSLSPSHQQGALCHELIHVRRRDVAAALAEEMLLAVLWFHPWIWVIRRRVRVAREQVVDRRVLALTGDRAEYVRCLIEMSGHDLIPHLSQAGAGMVRSNELRARVDVIFQEVRMSRLRFVTVSAVLAAVVGAAAWLAAAQAPLFAMAPQTVSAPPGALTLTPVERAPAAVNTVQQAIQTIREQSSPVTPVASGGKPVTMNFNDADVRQVLQTLGTIGGLDMVLDPKVAGRITLSMNQTPWNQVLDAVLRISGLGYQVDGNVVSIAPLPVAERLAQAAAQQVAAPNQMRRLIKVAYAEYPPEALDKQISGIVKATIVVNAAGDVTVADVTSGPAELRTSAFKAAMGLKYSPGTETARINISLEYRLDPQSWGVRVIQESGSITSTNLAVQAATLEQKMQALRGALGQVDSPAAPPGAVRVGGAIRAPTKIKDAAPVYPPAAREAGVQGVVILEVTIDEAGNVSNAKVLRSIPLLDQAAIDSVTQWQYTPTLLNGVPVPVIMTVTVNFTLRSDPTVTLNIVSPTGRTGMIRMMDQAGVGIFDIPDVGKFGFTPVRGSSPTGRSVQIYQVGEPGSPLKLLGSVQVELNGGMVQSSTTPSFGVELAGIP